MLPNACVYKEITLRAYVYSRGRLKIQHVIIPGVAWRFHTLVQNLSLCFPHDVQINLAVAHTPSECPWECPSLHVSCECFVVQLLTFASLSLSWLACLASALCVTLFFYVPLNFSFVFVRFVVCFMFATIMASNVATSNESNSSIRHQEQSGATQLLNSTSCELRPKYYETRFSVCVW